MKLHALQTHLSVVLRFVVLITCKRKLHSLKYAHEAGGSADAAVHRCSSTPATLLKIDFNTGVFQ